MISGLCCNGRARTKSSKVWREPTKYKSEHKSVASGKGAREQSSGARERQKRGEWSREGVDEQDAYGTRRSSRTEHDSHFESYGTIFNTCYIGLIHRTKLNGVAIGMESGRKQITKQLSLKGV